MTYQELIWRAPTADLKEQVERDKKAVKVAQRFLTPYPGVDPKAITALEMQIKLLQGDIRLICEELEFRKRPGPRDWSPRGLSGRCG